MPGITDPAEAYFKDGLWSFDGTQWRKQPLLFGYSDILLQQTINADLPIATSNVDLPACVAGYIYVYTHLAFSYLGTPPTQVEVRFRRGADPYLLFKQLLPASGVVYDRQGWWLIKEDDFISARVWGATLNDDLTLTGTGFMLKINE